MRRMCLLLVASLGAAVALGTAPLVVAQTTSGPGVDVEIFNPATGDNAFCASPGETFWAYLFVRPGGSSVTCSHVCGTAVAGGAANIAAAAIDVTFDTAALEYVDGSASNNPNTAAVDGLRQEQNAASGRVGWALAGDWEVDADPSSNLKSPCAMKKLDEAAWAARFQFRASQSGFATLRLRRETDASPFPLSFADICGSPAFREGTGDIDEVVHGIVLVGSDCASALFFDSFENAGTRAWTVTQG